MTINREQAADVLLGTLYGDCLGAPYEFSRGRLTGDIRIGPSVFGHPAGEGTDDTETTIAVAEGLLAARASGGSATELIAERLLAWYAAGPPDVGGTTADGLLSFRSTGDPRSGATTDNSVANGSLMRSAPFALIGDDGPELAVDSSRTTHGHPQVLDCVRAEIRILQLLLAGEEIDPDRVTVLAGCDLDLHPEPQPENIPCAGIGHAIYALDLAVWAATGAEDFASGIERIIRLGGDTDTNGAICGAVLAARFGLPVGLRSDLAPRRVAQLSDLADRLVG